MTAEIKLELSLGRSFEEYVQMFRLTADDLSKRMIGCSDGFSNFNQRMNELGYPTVSCDPIYHHSSKEDLREYMFQKKSEPIQLPTKKPEDSFFLYSLRRIFIEDFLDDYEQGKQEGRYRPHSLPTLPFEDKEFDIALSSYFLFTYASLGSDFHSDSIREMLRVANEVRIYPLIDLNCQRPAFLDAILEKLRAQQYQAEIVEVEYGFHRNDGEMLWIQKLGLVS